MPAPVGFHCVDCVAEAARTAPEQRTALGAPVRRGRPVVTLTLIGLCVVAYVLQRTVPAFTGLMAFSPVYGVAEPWRFLTSAFLHAPGQLLHIAFNMLALWMVGPYLEQTLGRARYVTLYLLSAVGGSVGALALATATDGWLTWLVGASGAVFGLFGAVLVVLRRLGRDARGIVGVLVVNGVLGFVVPGISWQAHLGGLVVGAALGAAYAYAPKERRRLVAVLAPVVVAASLAGVSLAVYASVGFV